MSDLLWEIGCEEIPSRMLPDAAAHLANAMQSSLEQASLFVAQETRILWCHATPRRLAVAVTGLRECQPDLLEDRRGPPVERAFDPQGQPTKAAEGFARVCGVSVTELSTLETPKGSYLAYTIRTPGRVASVLLPDLLASILTAFPWPKSMRWGAGETRFVRPIRWMVALLDGVVVPVRTVDGLTAADVTWGHRFMAPGPFQVQDADSYLAIMAQSRVIPSLEQRADKIRSEVAQLAAQAGGSAFLDEDLVLENAGLTEWPVPMLGNFDPKYLEIPKEVLATSMKYHQKYFPVQRLDGTLMPCFVAVANLEPPDPAVLVRGYERVLRARLEDAAFYWREDRKIPLPERLSSLQKVVFQVRLGTLHKKAMRMATLAGTLADRMDSGLESGLASKAAILAKCDLTTGMVGEFPELQGVMGGYYALAAGEHPAVATAIREHYQPRGAGDAVPGSLLGTLVSLADKLDTLTGCFGIGLVPTGTKDPFGLRRAALGVIRMILDGGLRLPLLDILAQAHMAYPAGVLDEESKATSLAILDFFYGRLKVYLRRDFDYDLIDAVQVLGLDDLYDVVSRVRALAVFKQQESFVALVAANKRIVNLLDKADQGDPGQGGDLHGGILAAEIALFDAVRLCHQKTAPLIQVQNYAAALEILATLQEPIDRFFADVLVMDPDVEIRRNRLALLRLVRQGFDQIADVSRLACEG
ncbi:MAG: glycine--tRNA ligase subunit beta [Magnetococcus sp. YQC-5]